MAHPSTAPAGRTLLPDDIVLDALFDPDVPRSLIYARALEPGMVITAGRRGRIVIRHASVLPESGRVLASYSRADENTGVIEQRVHDMPVQAGDAQLDLVAATVPTCLSYADADDQQTAAARSETMTVTVRDHAAEAPWGSGMTNPVTRKVTISAFCPTCGGRRGEPQGLNQCDDGAYYWVQTWSNPCGHVDMYAAVVAEAAVLAGKAVTE